MDKSIQLVGADNYFLPSLTPRPPHPPLLPLPPGAVEMDRDTHAPPSAATDAVLVKSVEMPENAQKVEELDFNKFKGRPITVDDLFQGMKHMGFQASSMCEAVRIINEMVRTG